METKKTILIIIDGADSTKKIADAITAVLDGYQVLVRPVENFAGTDLLPAHALFLGCAAPRPVPFTYIAEMLQHINLAGRPCGVFSADSKALKYLADLVKASEAAVGKPFLAKGGAAGSAVVMKWVQGILN